MFCKREKKLETIKSSPVRNKLSNVIWFTQKPTTTTVKIAFLRTGYKLSRVNLEKTEKAGNMDVCILCKATCHGFSFMSWHMYPIYDSLSPSPFILACCTTNTNHHLHHQHRWYCCSFNFPALLLPSIQSHSTMAYLRMVKTDTFPLCFTTTNNLLCFSCLNLNFPFIYASPGSFIYSTLCSDLRKITLRHH